MSTMSTMSTVIITSLIISLLLTLILEVGFFFACGKRNKKDILLVILVNIFTNPLVVLSFWLTHMFTGWNTFFVVIPMEIFAILVEGRYYKVYGNDFKRPYLFSLCANVFSYGTGLLIQHFVM